jgi:hypothetical protein
MRRRRVPLERVYTRRTRRVGGLGAARAAAGSGRRAYRRARAHAADWAGDRRAGWLFRR